MAIMRSPKWDWKSHEARMKELYDLRMSIPDIHEAIQCEGFKPCLSSVYSKFRSLNLPTDPVERTQLLDTISPHSPGYQATLMQGIVLDDLANNQSPDRYGRDISLVPKDSTLEQLTRAWDHECIVSSPIMGFAYQYDSLNEQLNYDQTEGENLGLDGYGHSATFQTPSDMHPGTPWNPPNNSTMYESCLDEAFSFQPLPAKTTGIASFEQNPGIFNPESFLVETSQEVSLGMELQSNAAFFNCQRNEQSLPKHRPTHLFEISNTSSAARSSNSIRKIRSLFRPKSGNSSGARRKYADSQLTTDTGDSGYMSAFTSTTSLEDIPDTDPRSLDEFNGLYRAACRTLHEPHSKAQWKNIPTCSCCRYSSIHNLAWSARYLKFEVFSLELRLTDYYDPGALDAAGNTALHYAAASGAGLKYLKALVEAGVDPYIANTANELFIYCLRPLQPFSLEPNSDCFDGDDLIHLLGLLQPQLAFGWRDNNGQTIMHALALKVTEPRLKAKFFKFFEDAGYPATIRDRHGRTAVDVDPLSYGCDGQIINPNFFKSLEDTIESVQEVGVPTASDGSIHDELPFHPVKQIKAHHIIAKAHQKARYIDPESGDNVVHALSRLKSGHDILENLDCFIQKDVDLNLHNREGQPPLVSFICNRSLEEYETGATMSKYLDLILWKNIKEHLHNNINVDMKDREGATALHCAAVRGRPDPTRSLIEAGANVNARLDNGSSILHATFDALQAASIRRDNLQVHLLKEVISHLEHAGAVKNPTSLQERGINKL